MGANQSTKRTHDPHAEGPRARRNQRIEKEQIQFSKWTPRPRDIQPSRGVLQLHLWTGLKITDVLDYQSGGRNQDAKEVQTIFPMPPIELCRYRAPACTFFDGVKRGVKLQLHTRPRRTCSMDQYVCEEESETIRHSEQYSSLQRSVCVCERECVYIHTHTYNQESSFSACPTILNIFSYSVPLLRGLFYFYHCIDIITLYTL